MNPEWFLRAIVTASAFYYSWFLLKVRKGLSQLQVRDAFVSLPSVSVVIAARNEQDNIRRCLESVVAQTYPSHLLSIILVDDASTDDTVSIARQFERKKTHITVVSLPEPGPGIRARKLRALAKGIQESIGEIVVITDADCTAGPDWITSIIRSFDNDSAFVAGPVREIPSSGLLSQLSSLEFYGLIAVAAGLIANRTPIFCNGANVAFRRESYDAVGGYKSDDGFCDDEVLMQRIHRRAPGSIRYAIRPESIVSTMAPSRFREFWKQRIRWASKKGHYEDKTILVRLIGLYSFFFLMSFLAVLAVVQPGWWSFLGIMFAIKAISDFLTLRKAQRLFPQNIHFGRFLIAEVLHVPYIALAALAGQLWPLTWKGQRIRG